MHVQKLIAENPSWLAYLMNDLKIIVSRDDAAPHLVGLKYHMHESPMENPIARECRGMVVDIERNKIVAHPYNKFFNLGEPGADEIDWASARVLEKLDGSLMILYWDPALGWRIATSGNPTAAGSYGTEERLFRDAFWEAFTTLNMELPPPELRDVTWMFEFCAPTNRIVVKYDKPRIVLHGARDLQTGAELGHDLLALYAQLFQWEMIKSFPIATEADCRAAAAELDAVACEGYVVVDAAFRRVKVKSPRYVELHLMKGEMSPRRAAMLWQNGEAPELLAIFPELAPAILPVHEHLDRCAEAAVDATLAVIDQCEDRKAFAAKVKELPWAPYCFKLWVEIWEIRGELGIEPSRDALVESVRALMRESKISMLQRLLEVTFDLKVTYELTTEDGTRMNPVTGAPATTIMGIDSDRFAAAVRLGEAVMADPPACTECGMNLNCKPSCKAQMYPFLGGLTAATAAESELPSEATIAIPAGFRVPDVGQPGDSTAAAAALAGEMARIARDDADPDGVAFEDLDDAQPA